MSMLRFWAAFLMLLLLGLYHTFVIIDFTGSLSLIAAALLLAHGPRTSQPTV